MSMRRRLPRFLAGGWLILGSAGSVAAQAPYDLVLRGGTVIDGTGAARFRADIGIRGDRVVRISRTAIAPGEARRVIDATGRIIAPGFIDISTRCSGSPPPRAMCGRA